MSRRLSDSDAIELRRLRDKLDRGIKGGPGVRISNKGKEVIISVPGQKPRGADALPSTRFVARLENPQQDGANMRWTYDFTELVKQSSGYGGWTDKNGGRTGTAYNMAEDPNDEGATGHPFGNGVDSDNLLGTFAVKPIPEN